MEKEKHSEYGKQLTQILSAKVGRIGTTDP